MYYTIIDAYSGEVIKSELDLLAAITTCQRLNDHASCWRGELGRYAIEANVGSTLDCDCHGRASRRARWH